jgi:hypothetical protein
MSKHIQVNRERPITRPGQVERVLCKFGIGPRHSGNVGKFIDRQIAKIAHDELTANERRKLLERYDPVPVGFILTAEQMKMTKDRMYYDTTEWPKDYVSTADVEQLDDGSGIKLRIFLEDEEKATDLISELRMCGFVGRVFL